MVATRGTLRSPIIAMGSAVVLALALVWLVAVPIGPETCALSLPAPRNCFTVDRVQTAIVPTLIIIAAAVSSIVVIHTWPSRSRLIAVTSVIMLLVIAVASYFLIAWMPPLAWSSTA